MVELNPDTGADPTSNISSLAIQPDEEVLPSQLRGRQPDQQLQRR